MNLTKSASIATILGVLITIIAFYYSYNKDQNELQWKIQIKKTEESKDILNSFRLGYESVHLRVKMNYVDAKNPEEYRKRQGIYAAQIQSLAGQIGLDVKVFNVAKTAANLTSDNEKKGKELDDLLLRTVKNLHSPLKESAFRLGHNVAMVYWNSAPKQVNEEKSIFAYKSVKLSMENDLRTLGFVNDKGLPIAIKKEEIEIIARKIKGLVESTFESNLK